MEINEVDDIKSGMFVKLKDGRVCKVYNNVEFAKENGGFVSSPREDLFLVPLCPDGKPEAFTEDSDALTLECYYTEDDGTIVSDCDESSMLDIELVGTDLFLGKGFCEVIGIIYRNSSRVYAMGKLSWDSESVLVTPFSKSTPNGLVEILSKTSSDSNLVYLILDTNWYKAHKHKSIPVSELVSVTTTVCRYDRNPDEVCHDDVYAKNKWKIEESIVTHYENKDLIPINARHMEFHNDLNTFYFMDIVSAQMNDTIAKQRSEKFVRELIEIDGPRIRMGEY